MLAVERMSKSYGSMVAIADLTFEVREREFCCIVGPSGCGKTTLLRCAAGLLPLTSGRVLLEGRPVTGPPEQMALVFQEYGRSLYPWLTVERNVRLPLGRKRLAEPAAHDLARG